MTWNVDTLKEHFDERFRAKERSTEESSNAMTARLLGMNEWRETVTDILNRALTRDEYAAHHKQLEDRLIVNAARLDRLEGRGLGRNDIWGYIVGASGLVFSVVSVIVLLSR